jgi:Asp-tRNA(Asn)/Glu-tRNA(Gln) amidotransferase A subunit family amidase
VGLERIGRAVRERRVSAVELVRRSLERIERLDGDLNAVVALRAEPALDEAAALDRRLADGAPLGPLAGAPLLVKDIEDVAGMPTTFGSLLFKDAPPAAADGLVTGRLRAAGAIVVGKTNLPEFAAEGYTANSLFGVTRSPWALRWSPGGSSGGSGAALAAGMAPLATATDGGGSIRIPAALCGLAGIKPSGGLIGRRPIPDWIDLSTDGPLATSVEDLRLLLEIEAGPVAGDPTALPAPPSLARGERPARPGKLLAAPRFVPWGPLPAEVAELFDAALLALERDLGLAVEPVSPERIFRAGNLDEDWLTLTATEHAHKLGRHTIEAARDLLHPAGRAFLEHGLRTPIEEYLAARRRRFEYVRELDELLGPE